ncbi:MAG: dephospho-CoA kinase [Xanthobacteraceae bacterium]|jgi:dephospho-CoA kinase
MSAPRPFVLCLTGSLGMGKSATAKMFAEAGVPVHDSDAVVHDLYAGEAAPLIEAAFPGSTAGGKVDRQKLAAIVINDKTALKRLEAIVHPLVSAARSRFLSDAGISDTPIVLIDIPLLFEIGGESRCNAIVVVSAPAEMQQARAMQRPGMTEEKFTALVAKQVPDAEKRRRADFIVDTSQGFDRARAQVRDILDAVAKMQKQQ